MIVPLAAQGMAVTALWGFLTELSRFTLPMVLRGMVGQYASGSPWAQFAAMSILMSIPATLPFFGLQRYLVAGLAADDVRGNTDNRTDCQTLEVSENPNGLGE